ncbi:hypothetical protein D0Y65_026612 [Glycine soja]|uniref:Uncharacterized protein n=1 Tax=Glycine soja TaxID=3848 RepID=A0A445IKN7_GLYSO|nr:hypothetical protein D0Y65_026612 [Glycine soja]
MLVAFSVNLVSVNLCLWVLSPRNKLYYLLSYKSSEFLHGMPTIQIAVPGKVSLTCGEAHSHQTQSFEVLELSNNDFHRMIPPAFGNNLFYLEYLDLYLNKLEGPIPGSIFSPGKLEVRILTQNNSSGDLPEEIRNWQTLFCVQISSS